MRDARNGAKRQAPLTAFNHSAEAEREAHTVSQESAVTAPSKSNCNASSNSKLRTSQGYSCLFAYQGRKTISAERAGLLQLVFQAAVLALQSIANNGIACQPLTAANNVRINPRARQCWQPTYGRAHSGSHRIARSKKPPEQHGTRQRKTAQAEGTRS